MPNGQAQRPSDIIPLKFTGGYNNKHPGIVLFARDRGETGGKDVDFDTGMVNCDISTPGQVRILRPLKALNTAESNSIHSIIRTPEPKVFVGTGYSIKYGTPGIGTLGWDAGSLSALTTLGTLTSDDHISFALVGDWLFGTTEDAVAKFAIWLGSGGPTLCDWGIDDLYPDAPTVAAGAAGNPDGDYTCYVSWKVQLPDGTYVYSDLSTASTVDVTGGKKIEWSGVNFPTFTGASAVQAQLWRTATGLGGTYLVTTLDEGTTTYSDDVSDANLILNTAFAEDGYYPPPSEEIVCYHPGADRIFMAGNGDIWWSEAAMYHIFMYDSSIADYENVNSVFLGDEDITALVMLDEQLYIGSNRTWRRLRGKNPSYWSWEPTAARKGPVSWKAVEVTPWGILYPANDGYLWMFNGFNCNRILEHFVQPTRYVADSTHSTFDGRFYRLFNPFADNPLLVIDFEEYPSQPPKVMPSTQNAVCSHYDKYSGDLYFGDSDGYIRASNDTDTDVTIKLTTAEIPAADMARLGDQATLVLRVNTQGNDMTVQVTQLGSGDGDTVDTTHTLATVNTTSLKTIELPLPYNTYYALRFYFTLTASEEIILEEPWFLRKDG